MNERCHDRALLEIRGLSVDYASTRGDPRVQAST